METFFEDTSPMKIFTQLRKLIYEKREKNYKTKDNVTRQAAATSEKKTSN